MKDLIQDGSYTPEYREITDYIEEPGRSLWQDFNSFVQEKYKASPKIMYSICSGKPGWNVKYQSSGKSLCTLYPEKNEFVALVVITLDLVPIAEAMSGDFEKEVLDMILSAKPFNGTKWLMIRVNREAVLDNVKQLLMLKHEAKKASKR